MCVCMNVCIFKSVAYTSNKNTHFHLMGTADFIRFQHAVEETETTYNYIL